MSYRLLKPYTDNEYADFIVNYNHRLGLRIEKTDSAVYALEDDEIIVNGVPQVDSEYESKLRSERRNQFEQDFFETSLGWIRRKVNMQDGSVKDFLSDLLMAIKAGIDLGQEIKIITYELPDFSNEISSEYMESLQEEKIADLNFVRECLDQIVKDFGIQEGGQNGV